MWIRRCAYGITVVLLLSGCSSYTSRAVLIKDALAQDDYEEALEQVEEINKGTSELLYLYEKGLVLHSQSRYEESNEALYQAELLLDDLYTKSVSREVAALVVSDQVARYRGEAFETVYVNYYKMLNYWYLGSTEDAMVEARRLNNKIKFLPGVEDDVFVDSPFLQWFTGMMYEEGRERSDADVSYRNAVASYENLESWLGIGTPTALACDLVGNAGALGDRETVERYSAGCDAAAPVSQRRPDSLAVAPGEVTILLECGFVAGKIAREIVIPIYKDDKNGSNFTDDSFAEALSHRVGQPRRRTKLDYVLKISLPDLVVPHSAYRRAHVQAISARDTVRATVVLAEDLNAWEKRAFEAKQAKVLIRAIVRGLAKYAAKQAAAKEDETLGWLVNLLGAATEVADTRTWSTLPERIFVTHLTLPAGSWKLKIELFNQLGRRVGTLDVPDLQVTGGQKSFLNYRVY
jgi:hypothetical protein